jgi:ketosteroid isomerase-like protein
MEARGQTPELMVRRLLDATNRHDLEGLVDCFEPDYVNETPLHPARSFTGSEQVRRNWEQIFAFVPDLRATVTRQVVDDDQAWTEWEMSGTRPDGSPHVMRGVVIFTVREDRATAARFYLEPVDPSESDVNDAVQAIGRRSS